MNKKKNLSRRLRCLFILLLLILPTLLTPETVILARLLPQEVDPIAQCAEGMRLWRSGEDEKALPFLEAGFAGRDRAPSSALDDLGTCILALGSIKNKFGDSVGALEADAVAFSIFQETGNRFGEAVALNVIAQIYQDEGQYREALGYFQPALAIYREIGDRKNEGRALAEIGIIYRRLGQYSKALEYHEQALAIHREIGDRASEGARLNDIGVVYSSLGNYEQALDYSEQALAIRREIGDRAGEGTSLGNIGMIYHHLGEYAKALGYYEHALAIHRETGDREGEGVNLNGIGGVYNQFGDYAAALDYYEQALAIRREIGDLTRVGNSLGNIATVYVALGRYTEALEYYEHALAIHRETGNREGEGHSLNSIGMIYLDLGNHAAALDYCEQALAIQREIGDRAGEGTSLGNIGKIHQGWGEYAKSLDYFEQALVIHREIGNREGQAYNLYNIGTSYFFLESRAETLKYHEQALALREALRVTVGSETSRASYIAQYAFQYDLTIAVYHYNDQDERAFLASEQGRARAFLDQLATGYVQLSDTAADLYANEAKTFATRQAAQETLSRARSQWPDDTVLLADLEAQLAQAEVEYEAALAAITVRGDQLAALVPGRSTVLDVPQVQALLDEQTTLVAYWVLQDLDRMLVFVVTRDALRTVIVNVPYADLVAASNDFRSFANLGNAHPDSLVQLYGWLIAPVREHLTTAHLAIIPHDVLHYLPFAALTDGKHFLVQDYTLTYLPSASTLPFIQENAGRTGGAPLILGNPTTGEYDAVASFANKREGLGALPFAEQEARAIAALYDAPAYIGAEATEGLVRQSAGESGILHLAAHGKYNPVAPLQSLIALAPDDEHDGWLTVGEIYGLDLQQADLVVLSACETQLGDLSRGDELVGMPRAFIYAGTPTVIASLWSVDDAATARLMEHFYTHLQAGLGKAEALRQAQLDIQAENPHPYYWAGFVLSGDGGEIGIDATKGKSAFTVSLSPWMWLVGSIGLLLIIVWGAGNWIKSQSTPEEKIRRFAPYLSEYLHAPELYTTSHTPYISGKVITINFSTKEIDPLFLSLPKALRPARPKEVGTIVWLDWGRQEVGEYANKAKAYVQTCEVKVIDKSAHRMIANLLFWGGDPPGKVTNRASDASRTGAKPRQQIIEFLMEPAKIEPDTIRTIEKPAGESITYVESMMALTSERKEVSLTLDLDQGAPNSLAQKAELLRIEDLRCCSVDTFVANNNECPPPDADNDSEYILNSWNHSGNMIIWRPLNGIVPAGKAVTATASFQLRPDLEDGSIVMAEGCASSDGEQQSYHGVVFVARRKAGS